MAINKIFTPDMSSSIKHNLTQKMRELNLSMLALEKKSNLKRGVVSNIVNGLSLNPTSETLIALADTFGCSVDELLGRTVTPHIQQQINNSPLNEKLLLNTVEVIIKELKNTSKSISTDQSISIIKEVYRYSQEKNDNIADIDFVRWLVGKL